MIEKVAALEAVGGGDAREAIELLDACGKLALARGLPQIRLSLVEVGIERLESDTVLDLASVLPLHQKLLYLALLAGEASMITSNDAWEDYLSLCRRLGHRPLSRRRIQRFLVQFDESELTDSEMGYQPASGKKGRRITFPYPKAIQGKVRHRLRQHLGLGEATARGPSGSAPVACER